MALALGVAPLVILLAALTIRAVARWITNPDRAQQLRAERAAVYQQLVDSWSRQLQAEHEAGANGVPQSPRDLSLLDSALVLHGSAAAITAYVRLRATACEAGPHSTDTQSAYARMVDAMLKRYQCASIDASSQLLAGKLTLDESSDGIKS